VLLSLSLTHSVSLVGFGFSTHETSTQANLTPGSVSPRPSRTMSIIRILSLPPPLSRDLCVLR
jgi:hypothetical protein